MKIRICLFCYMTVIFEKDGRWKWPIKYDWLCLFIVAQETLVYGGYHVSGFSSFISHLLLGTWGIHARFLKTLTGKPRTFIFCCCITKPHKFNSLGQIPTYYPLASVGQKSGRSITGFSTQGLTRLKSRYWQGGVLIWFLVFLSKLIQVVGVIEFFAVVDWGSYWLLTKGLPPLLETGPSHVAFSQHASLLFQSQQENLTPVGYDRGLHNVRSDLQNHRSGCPNTFAYNIT